jgi:uncharacterized membrane protein
LNESQARALSEERLSGRARLFLTAVLAGASTCLVASPFSIGASLPAVLTRNEIPLRLRLAVIGVAWLAGLGLGALCLWIDIRSKTPSRFRQRATAFLAPWTLAAFVPLLFCQDAWEKREFAHLIVLLGFGLALERTLTFFVRTRESLVHPSGASALDAPKWLRPLCLVAVLGMSIFYFVRIGQLTVISHEKMATTSSDLAEYDNMFFNALHGHPFRSPAIAAMLKDFSSLQGHAELSLYLLLPFYAIAPGAIALLWIQTGLVAFAAVPQYLLARARMHPIAAMAFPIVHLTMPAVQQPNFYDFHFTAGATFFVSWLLYFLHSLSLARSRGALFGTYFFMACALCCREDVAIGIAVLGLFLILQGALVRDGLRILLVGAVYFVAMKFLIMPLFGTWWFETQYSDLQARGAKGFGSVILTLLSNQAYVLRALLIEPKGLYLLHMTVPVLALWLRKPLLLLAILPGFVSTLLVTNRPPLFQTSFQYTYLWIPYVVSASILAVRSKFAFAAAIPLVIIGLSLDHQRGVLLGGTSILGGFGVKTFEVSDSERTRLANLKEIIALIPPEASVAATEAEGPHVSNRLVLYSLKFSLGHDPDYLLVGHAAYGEEATHLRKAVDSGHYGVVATKGHFILAKRGADKSKNGELSRRIRGR